MRMRELTQQDNRDTAKPTIEAELFSMRILITGVSGFIGRHLVQRLQMDGHELIGVVREKSKLGDLNLGSISLFTVADISRLEHWHAKLDSVDAIVHLAACVHVIRKTASDTLQAFRDVNVTGTRRLAEAAVAAKVPRFVYLSTIKVNGDRTVGLPFTADDTPAPEGPYATSKLEAEQVLKGLINQSSTEFVTIRPPLVYGPNVRGNLERLMKLVRIGLPLPLAAVTNQRSMVSIGNLVDFISTCLMHQRAANQTFLVSDGYDWSTPELIANIAASMGKQPKLFPLPVSLMKRFSNILGAETVVERLCDSLQISITKNQKILQWVPVQSKKEALQITVNAYLKSLTND